MAAIYGPPTPPIQGIYPTVRNRKVLSGAANKIIYDLQRWFRIYTGIEAVIFQYNRNGSTRCPDCTDEFTGEAILSNCETCYGTGVVPGYIKLGTYLVGINFNPRFNVATDLGNTVTNGVKEDYFCIVGCPQQLQDRDILIIKNSGEAYKVVEHEPDIMGLGGYLIMQVVTAPLLEKGNVAYKLSSLITDHAEPVNLNFSDDLKDGFDDTVLQITND